MTERPDKDVPRHQTVRSVVKAMQLLLRIADADGGIAAAEIARELGIPLATAYHLLNTMLAEGFLARDSARRYHLGPKIATLAVSYGRSGPSEELLGELRRLADETGETAYLSEWRDNHVVALATIEGSNPVRVGGIHSELRGMEHARASGKLMLSELDESALARFIENHELVALTPHTIVSKSALRRELRLIKKVGYALEEEEFCQGVACVSAPVRYGTAIAGCLTVSAPVERFKEHSGELIAAVLQSARAASRR